MYFLGRRFTTRGSTELEETFRGLPFKPYRPVRYQLFRLLEEVNAVRKRAGGLTPVPGSAVRFKRRVVEPLPREANGRGSAKDPAAQWRQRSASEWRAWSGLRQVVLWLSEEAMAVLDGGRIRGLYVWSAVSKKSVS